MPALPHPADVTAACIASKFGIYLLDALSVWLPGPYSFVSPFHVARAFVPSGTVNVQTHLSPS